SGRRTGAGADADFGSGGVPPPYRGRAGEGNKTDAARGGTGRSVKICADPAAKSANTRCPSVSAARQIAGLSACFLIGSCQPSFPVLISVRSERKTRAHFSARGRNA